jgi:hypothetical protein
MNSYFRLNNIVYWLALIVWISALISAGVSAMNVFTVLDQDNLPLQIDRYGGFPVEEHPRLAASHVMEPVFATVDLLQFAAVPLMLTTLVLQFAVFKMSARRISNMLRIFLLVVAATGFTYHAVALAPPMNSLLRQWWTAAEAGDVAGSEAIRRQFDQWHGKADLILRLNLFFLLGAAGASAVAFTPVTDRKFEQPRLLKT